MRSQLDAETVRGAHTSTTKLSEVDLITKINTQRVFFQPKFYIKQFYDKIQCVKIIVYKTSFLIRKKTVLKSVPEATVANEQLAAS